uniref:Raptor N-terminal CASPase-like domain-containing protein n=1 Tax=Kwoniella dejecticola CBS 10117 TaxID=1296121 RepID=A0A1A6A4U0_9TREE|nr:uncharacterized protein I303_04406 [Kwoniella dejecticola CBS 10117]OBR85075.1 hypothetical protein I303_04406 [Kwoniella dejecticola CBS 10117]
MPPPHVSDTTQMMVNQSMRSERSVNSSGWITTNTSSWASTRGLSGAFGSGLGSKAEFDRPPLAWAGIRHQVREEEEDEDDNGGDAEGRENSIAEAGQCTQAVLITCLHLQHEMGMRDVGQYAWTTPVIKDPTGSMMRIMKRESGRAKSDNGKSLYPKSVDIQLRILAKQANLDCRAAPDPSKLVIQHHLQRARQHAGQDNYVAVIYNGHGIEEPPTDQGELWCYDRGFDECLQSGGGPSEYIPIMLFDVMAWAGSSTCYVWDVSHSGRFLKAALVEAEEIDNQFRVAAGQNPQIAELHPPVYAKRQIHFASCGANQSVPRINGMPDDLFTACLTNPLRIALWFHNLQTFPLTKGGGEGSRTNYLPRNQEYMNSLWDNMSANLKNRLEYELTSIIHTIAWQALNGRSGDYQKLFGKTDDLVNSLATGFILSQRVLGAYNVVPESIPSIPSSTGHTLWTTWDLILDNFFEQLPRYFDDPTTVNPSAGPNVASAKWEEKIKLVSFMQDQLESITTLGQSLFVPSMPASTAMTPGLARLPIICAAAMTKSFRVQACQALDSCLKVLDVKGLQHAVQGGALDVAAKLLDIDMGMGKGEDDIRNHLISIWSSLVRYDVAVLALTKEGLTAERLTDVHNVKFFLDALEDNLIKDVEDDDPAQEEERISLIIQNAAVLSTISSFVKGRKAPRFVVKTLSMSGIMLRSNTELVKQWGALLIAEVLGSLDQPEDKSLIGGLRENLVMMVKSNSVETRATAIYALQQWIPVRKLAGIPDDDELKVTLAIVSELLEYSDYEGSPLVRRELARMYIRVLKVADGYATLALSIWILQQGVKVVNEKRTEVQAAITSVGRILGIKQEHMNMLRTLQKLIQAVKTFNTDPDDLVCRIVSKRTNKMFRMLAIRDEHSTIGEDDAAGEKQMGLPGQGRGAEWTNELLDVILQAKDNVLRVLVETRKADKDEPQNDLRKAKKDKSKKFSNELFERTKLVLQSYLTAGRRADPSPEKIMVPQNGESRERTWTMRHRVLEDSLVVAEQQVGLPWKWQMKDITSPEPWTTMTFHSFHSTVMSCNRSHDLLLWDWSTSRKTGHVHLDLPRNEAITSARFVNELHEQTVILAEITNGDIHILAGPQDPSKIKPIANFRALDLSSSKIKNDVEYQRRLITSWYRSSGLLCVGGYSEEIRVWDCPAEKCVQTLATDSNVPVTTLITEPVSGNLILAGLANGQIKLFDLRQSQMNAQSQSKSKKKALITWQGDLPTSHAEIDLRGLTGQAKRRRGLIKIGVVLGESKNLSSACANGIINTYDLRNLSQPSNSVLSHDNGISYASFQAHSGLLSTISNLSGSGPGSGLGSGVPLPQDDIVTQASLSSESGKGQQPPNANISTSASANFSLYRTSLGSISTVNSQTIHFDQDDNLRKSKYHEPYTTIHPLRPFLSVGYGTKCHLIGSGIGQGDDTDSGSYSFLRAQAGNSL